MTIISITNSNLKFRLPNAAMTFIMKKQPQEVASLYCITLWWCKQKHQGRKHNKKAGSVADWATCDK